VKDGTLTQTSLVLQWDASTDNVGVTLYRIYRDGTKIGEGPGSAGGWANEWTVSGLSCGSRSTYTVQALDAVGNVSRREFLRASTLACSSTSPSVPTISTISPTSGPVGSSVTIYGTNFTGATSVTLGFVAASFTVNSSLRITAVVPSGTTSGRWRVTTPGGTATAPVDFQTTQPADVTPPSAPQGLRITSTSQSSVSVAWDASTDSVGVVGYGVYKSGVLAGSGAATTYYLGSLSCGTSYVVAVDAVDGAGNRSAKTSMTATTSPCGDIQPPSMPANLRVKAGTLTQASLVLAWDPSSDNVGVTLYRIYRNGAKLGEGSGSAGGWSDEWTVTGLACGTQSQYAVEALDAAGNVSSRATLNATTAACSDTTPPTAPTLLTSTGVTPTSVSLSWTASLDNVGVAGYGIYVGGAPKGTSTFPAMTLSGLSCSTDYMIEVDSFDAAGNRSSTKASTWITTAACLDAIAPTAPTNFRVTGTAQTSLTAAWSAATDNVGVTGYRLYLNGALKGTTTSSLTYGFAGLQCGTTYALAVEAYDGSDNASPRAQLSAATSACSTPPPPSGSASVYMSPAGSDSNACTQISPCKSLDRAYRVAQPGQVVEIAAGTYASQRINGDTSKTSATDVVFQPAAGAVVTFGELSIYADHLELRDLKLTGGWKTYPETDDVTLRNDSSKHLFIWSSSNISVIGGEVGPNLQTTYDSNIVTYSGSQTPPTNILIDGVNFHDWVDVDPGNANHIECLQIGSGVNVTIRNSRFWNCSTHDIFIRSWGTLNGSYHPLKNFVVENNFLAKTVTGYYAIQFIDDLATDSTSFTVRNNTSLQSFHDDIKKGTISFTGNIFDSMSSWECSQSSPSRYSYNVYESGVKCGSTDIVGPVTYRNRSALDLHLMPGSIATNRGNPNSYPSADIDGQSRPAGGMPDAGADEAG
jgi:chitodextrinase